MTLLRRDDDCLPCHCLPRQCFVALLTMVFGLACAPGRRGSSDTPAVAPLHIVLPPAPEADDDKPKWDVEQTPGRKHDVPIDTRSGTWMSVDVSPDGSRIVFDLLGDLYSLPISGGEAIPLTRGMAWDMQPRFSPDGRFVAFTSDRDGGDNIWIIPAEGGELRQVTREDFRLVNSPAWSQDGQFIAVRKHFTASRSLGAGEIWLYHVAGGKGLQVTEKQNDQKDTGEPAFSPDGRYIYYSQDITPGAIFEYNKDPHAGIYAIKRLDRRDGRIDTLLDGPGGAARPTPSPDGKKLAYVRRNGLDTVLVVHDLVSGAERVVDPALDRDMQETWAIHGVYPSLAWLPASDGLVYWARGGLMRTNLAGNVTAIPFHVEDSRRVTRALRYPVEVHPPVFHTKMLRWVEVAPDGKSVVFQALGHLYIKDLPNGRPARLTRDDVFEFYPSWSRDGKSIVYTTWDEEKLGSVRVVPRSGGTSRTVTDVPGHYITPTMSPDGQHIVVRKVRGGELTTRQWSNDPGLYVVPASGGTPRLLAHEGNDPHFGRASDRVYFTVAESGSGKDDKHKAVLKSIALTGADTWSHATSANATRYRVSPDDRFLAFQERFNAYVTAMPATGRPLPVSAEGDALPIKRLSADAGEYLHWSGRSDKLYWSLGPELFSRDLADASPWVPDAVAKEEKAAGLDLGFKIASDAPSGRVAFVGGRIVTMHGDEIIEDGVIVVRDNRIEAVGPRANVTIPPGTEVIDVRGTTIIPGLVDVHAHGPQGEDGIVPQHSWLHYATLAFGVTTVHDPSNETGSIFAAAELARAGLITAPRIFSTGTILYGAETAYQAVVEDLDDARSHLRRMKAVGAFSVKSYNQPRRSQRQLLLAAARELEMMVVPEGGSLYHHDMTMVIDGHTGLEHALPVARAYDDVVALWSGTAVGYTPTIVVGYGGLWGENYWYAQSDVFAHPRLRRFVPPSQLEARSRRRLLASTGDWNHIEIARLAAKLQHAGVSVQLGAHGQREGLAAHWELWSFVQGGMSPLEALRAGTLDAAAYLGLDGDLGSIETGKLADLAIIEGDVLRDIHRSEHVRFVVANGRVFDAATMEALWPRRAPRPAFFWQRFGR